MNEFAKFYELLEKTNMVYTPENESKIIARIGELMAEAGIKSKAINYYFNVDEDFLPDTLALLPRNPVTL